MLDQEKKGFPVSDFEMDNFINHCIPDESLEQYYFQFLFSYSAEQQSVSKTDTNPLNYVYFVI